MQTVNLLAKAYVGSNPSLPTIYFKRLREFFGTPFFFVSNPAVEPLASRNRSRSEADWWSVLDIGTLKGILGAWPINPE
jgi:hypothetical protein